jgi:hypothetical protein
MSLTLCQQALVRATAADRASPPTWEYRKVLFERHKDLSPDNFEKWAGELGLDREEFGPCLESKRRPEEREGW